MAACNFLLSILLILLPAVFLPAVQAQIQGPLTSDFINWLGSNGYGHWVSHFERNDLGKYGSFGGKTSSGQKVRKTPVIFIHGNSDQALNDGSGDPLKTGWTASIQYFMKKGYTSAELYATTWGQANAMYAAQQTHSCSYLQTLRAFVQAVLKYTGASKVSIVTHSMGVTLGRGLIKGGKNTNQDGSSCNLGSPLTSNVDTFIGIAGGNRGLVACEYGDTGTDPTCNDVNGFDPGVCFTLICQGNVDGMSSYLARLDARPHHYEASHLFSIWSRADEIVGYGDEVWGYPTSEIPQQDGEYVSDFFGHIETKDLTTDKQYKMVTQHTVN